MSDNNTLLENMITNVCMHVRYFILISERLHACPLFYLNHVGYKNLLEISLEFDAFLNDCLNDVIIRIP